MLGTASMQYGKEAVRQGTLSDSHAVLKGTGDLEKQVATQSVVLYHVGLIRNRTNLFWHYSSKDSAHLLPYRLPYLRL